MVIEEKTMSDFVVTGYALIEETDLLAKLSSEVFNAASSFFALPCEIKENYATPSLLEGYRPLGREYSAVPDRPDLTESFSFWPRNRSRESVLAWSLACEFYAKLNDLFGPLSNLTHALLESLKRAFSPQAPRIEFEDMSYLQVNYYEPRQQTRDYLQDTHEDGHLLTLLKATEKGLEIKIDGQFQEVQLAHDQILVMPGSLLTIMTGGQVSPMYHRVRTHPEYLTRLSLMFFVNPALDKHIAPWVLNDSNRGVDVRKAAVMNSAAFGLASLDEILKYSETAN